MHIPELLRDARRRHGLSIRAAALRCHVPRSTWAGWESGRAVLGADRLDEVLAELAFDLRLVERLPEPPGEQAVRRHLQQSLTERACAALGEQLQATQAACREAPRLLTGAAAVGVWVPHVVARGPLPLPRLPEAPDVHGQVRVPSLVRLCLAPATVRSRMAQALVPTPAALMSDGHAERWPQLLTSTRLLAREGPRDASGRRLPAHRDPDEERELGDLWMTLTWGGRGAALVRSEDSRAWRLGAPATLDEALLRQGLPPRNASRRPGRPR